MSRTFTNKTDESTLTTLCPRCLNAFRNTRGIRVRRADPYQLTKEPCTYCHNWLKAAIVLAPRFGSHCNII